MKRRSFGKRRNPYGLLMVRGFLWPVRETLAKPGRWRNTRTRARRDRALMLIFKKWEAAGGKAKGGEA